MKSKRYRVEAQARDLTTWEVAYRTNSLAVAEQYAASLRESRTILHTRVVDQEIETVVCTDPVSKWQRRF